MAGSNPEARGSLGYLQRSHLKSEEKTKKKNPENVLLFTSNLSLGPGPSLAEMGTLTLCPRGFSAGVCSIRKPGAPFLTAFCGKRCAERPELNRGQLWKKAEREDNR